MLLHIVLFNLKPGCGAAERELIAAKAYELLEPLPMVERLQAGPAIEANERTDCALVVWFKDEQALEDYRVHPEHVRYVKEVLDPHIEAIAGHDFTVDDNHGDPQRPTLAVH